MEQVLGSVSFQIPHSREVETQYLEGDDAGRTWTKREQGI